MSPVLPDYIQGIQPYEPGKPVEEVERELGLRDTVKLASNENPLGPSPRALDALRGALAGLHRYPDGGGHYLRSALAERHGVPPDQIVLGNGSTELVEILARTYLGKEGNAVISERAFIMYRIAVMAVNGNARMVPMAGMSHDLRAMAAAIDPRTRLVFVANPNNPTGTSVDGEALDHLLARIPAGALAVVDEAYWEYAREVPGYPDTLRRLRDGAPVVVLRTFSKAHGLAGLRIGYAVVPPGVARDLNRVRSPFNTNSLAQTAALAAMGDREHVERSVRLNRRERQALEERLAAQGFTVTPSVANFVLVETRLGAREAFQRLLRLGVIVRPVDAYGLPRGIRISVGTPEENRRLLEAAATIAPQAGTGGTPRP